MTCSLGLPLWCKHGVFVFVGWHLCVCACVCLGGHGRVQLSCQVPSVCHALSSKAQAEVCHHFQKFDGKILNKFMFNSMSDGSNTSSSLIDPLSEPPPIYRVIMG
jgi:hypothetical protein